LQIQAEVVLPKAGSLESMHQNLQGDLLKVPSGQAELRIALKMIRHCWRQAMREQVLAGL